MNYRETTTTGEIKNWRRAKKIEINNEYNQIPTVRFIEEDLTILPSGKIIKENEVQLCESFTSPLTEFNLIHPETGQIVGVGKYQDAYVILYSLYLDLANKRDVNESTVPVDPETNEPDI